MKGKLHHYSADTSDRRLVHVYLAVLSIILAYGLYCIFDKLQLTIAWWVDAPSVFGFYGIVYFLFNKYLWNRKFFKQIFFLKCPDWNGVYNCSIWTSYDNFQSKKDILIKIIQTWDSISVMTKTDTSHSTSLSGSFSIKDSVSPSFTYEYENQPNIDVPATMNIHKGMATLWFEGKKLKGDFFTGRGRNTFGKFESD